MNMLEKIAYSGMLTVRPSGYTPALKNLIKLVSLTKGEFDDTIWRENIESRSFRTGRCMPNLPARTITGTGGNQELVTPQDDSQFIMNPIRNNNGTDSFQPLGTITASRRHWHYLVTARGKSKSHSTECPAGALTTGSHIAFVSPQFLYRQFGDGGGQQQSIDTPSGSINAVPKLNLISAVNELKDFLIDTQYNNGPKSIDEPSPTQTAGRKHFYLINPQWFNNSGSSIEQPCFTLIARQDKTPASLILYVLKQDMLP